MRTGTRTSRVRNARWILIRFTGAIAMVALGVLAILMSPWLDGIPPLYFTASYVVAGLVLVGVPVWLGAAVVGANWAELGFAPFCEFDDRGGRLELVFGARNHRMARVRLPITAGSVTAQTVVSSAYARDPRWELLFASGSETRRVITVSEPVVVLADLKEYCDVHGVELSIDG